MDIKSGQIYRHVKSGNSYRIVALAKHSETLEDMVVYEALYENNLSKFWVRPVEMFLEIIEINGQKLPRFQLIQNA